MAHLLAATVPLTGHVHPMLLVVEALVRAGHQVTWYAAATFAPAIARTGATFAPMIHAPDWDDADVDAALPALRGRRGIARVKAELREMFIHPAAAQLHDLTALADAVHPDAVLADSAHLGAALLAEARGLPWVGLGISALMLPSRDTAPFGPGWAPVPGLVGRVRNRVMNRLVHRVMFADINRAYRAKRAEAGLPPGAGTYFDVVSPDLYLQPTVPAFEYPRADLPAQVHFIGPLVPRPPSPADALPAWWPEVEAARTRGTPIVLVTQGTLATDPRELLAPAARALADEPVLVIATTGRAGDGTLGLPAAPANLRTARFVPYGALLPHVAAIVTNGGYGGVQMALRHGVPLVVAGGSEEKPEIAARVAWAGVGLDLHTGRPRPPVIRRAVRRVLDEPAFRARAADLAAAMAAHDAPAEAAALIEALVRTRRPVVRGALAAALA